MSSAARKLHADCRSNLTPAKRPPHAHIERRISVKKGIFVGDDGRSVRKPFAAGVIGNVVEWYDFGIYGYLSIYLAANFFKGDGAIPILAIFATFAVGFVFRPLGGLFFGSFGDRHGRKNALAIVVIGISAATLGIGLLPTVAQIGWLAPVLLVAFRSIQGFCAGGEYAGASSFLYEYAPRRHRGLFGGFLGVSTYVAFLIGSLLSWALAANLSQADMNDWGWRIPFLLAGPLGIVGFLIRYRIEDTPKFHEISSGEEIQDRPVRFALSKNRLMIVLLTGFLFSNAVGPYLLITYVPAYLTRSVGFSASEALRFSTMVVILMIVLLPIVGAISDRVGRKPVMLASTILYVLVPIPAFSLISAGDPTGVIVGQALLAVAQSVSTGIAAVVISEIFPVRVRYTGASISYNTAYVIFGGTAPFVATYLVDITGNVLMPAYYVVVIALISTLFALKLPETHTRNRADSMLPGRAGVEETT